MSPLNLQKAPKAPRWITTEAGQWAWLANEEWRRFANAAMNVADRRKLLDEAERMRETTEAR